MSDHKYFRCGCHTPHHFVLFEPDPDIAGVLNVSVCADKNARFWHRVKWALKHILGTEHLTYGDIILERDEVARLAQFLAERDLPNPRATGGE